MKNRKEIYKKSLGNMIMEVGDLIIDGYSDPDGFPSNKSSKEYNHVFYEETCALLQCNLERLLREQKYKKILKGILFETDKNYKTKSTKGIFVVKDGKRIFQLKSDQFGFSAGYGTNKRVYPYRAYFENLPDKMVADGIDNIFGTSWYRGWINETRKPGGSFLWPIDFENDGKDSYGNNSYNPKYNSERGGHCYSSKKYYIQDRVDLTLYEIKEVYDNIITQNPNVRVKGNVLASVLYYKNGEKSKTYHFLELFKDFETFVKVFGFDGNFVRKVGNEWKIINIFETKIENISDSKKIKYIDDTYVNEARKGNKLFKTNTEYSKYENMFNLLVLLIKRRRRKINNPKILTMGIGKSTYDIITSLRGSGVLCEFDCSNLDMNRTTPATVFENDKDIKDETRGLDVAIIICKESERYDVFMLEKMYQFAKSCKENGSFVIGFFMPVVNYNLRTKNDVSKLIRKMDPYFDVLYKEKMKTKDKTILKSVKKILRFFEENSIEDFIKDAKKYKMI